MSGVLSTVTAGILMGSFGKHFGMSASTRVAVQDFWQYMGFLSNSFIFLLVGLELDPGAFIRNLPAVMLAFLVVVLARSIVVYAGIPIVDFFLDVFTYSMATCVGLGRVAWFIIYGPYPWASS